MARGGVDVSDVLLEARGLVKHYPVRDGVVIPRLAGHVKAVDGVDLQLRRGETLGIVGESGCGKSTLARLLMALERPTEGTITVLGESLSRLRGRRLRQARQHIQMVFQDPFTSLDPRKTVRQILAEPFRVHRDASPRGDRDRQINELIEVVGLSPDHGDRYPHQFSGGQRQRIGIARALALKPDILVCDEPVSALDVSVQAQVINLLDDLQQEFGLAYVFIAHNLSVVHHIADRVAVMYLGRIVEQGTSQEVYDGASHPFSQALLSAAPAPDPTLRDDRDEIVLEGEVPSALEPPSGCRFRTRCWKAQDICAEAEPALVDRGQAHPVACHFAEKVEVV
ncbi:MAG: ABC transporter ATP-binding protein [Nocardioides sp.]